MVGEGRRLVTEGLDDSALVERRKEKQCVVIYTKDGPILVA